MHLSHAKIKKRNLSTEAEVVPGNVRAIVTCRPGIILDIIKQ